MSAFHSRSNSFKPAVAAYSNFANSPVEPDVVANTKRRKRPQTGRTRESHSKILFNIKNCGNQKTSFKRLASVERDFQLSNAHSVSTNTTLVGTDPCRPHQNLLTQSTPYWVRAGL
jgi:hypothetical protein